MRIERITPTRVVVQAAILCRTHRDADKLEVSLRPRGIEVERSTARELDVSAVIDCRTPADADKLVGVVQGVAS